MKKVLTLVLVSILGGIMALTADHYLHDNSDDLNQESDSLPSFTIPTSFGTTNTFLTAEAPDFVTAAEKSVHAVVHVKNTAIRSSPSSLEDLIFGGGAPRAQIGTGSGVIISPDGYIITNNHVIAGSQQISITTNDNKIYEAELIGTDPKTDIAVLKINANDDLPYIIIGDSDQAKIGEWVLAVGNPFNLNSTVTAGIISAKSRDLTGNNSQSFIQTDAAVNPGNSGGALVNTKGELIGINTAISSQTGSYIGYSFAVPSNIARKVLEDIMEYGTVQNGMLGVAGTSLNSKYAEQLKVATSEGFYVGSVESGSGAYRAGIQEGDVITKLDNISINKFSDLKGYLDTKRPKDVVSVTILRDGNFKVIPVTLEKINSIQLPIIGTVKDANKEELRKYGVDYGVKISALSPKYADSWRKNGVTEGSIVTAINDRRVNSVEDAKQILESKSSNDPLKFEVINNRGEKETYYWR
ncbi:trypsin-like peptidase domain-containing protein [Aegicerativicinus sediminis]|uniref:trypsin-like peptidase domain-containing protein n=1 Tax=Aegicerativicinus sediminis TaxID=2893202 RepID=UPI001E4D9DFF|nr:trypsin-like peptidase domain-containing protein [Aegicerativicinus sediminis]